MRVDSTPIARIRVISLLCLAVVNAGCATSPLYGSDPSSGYGTVPRDEMGEPIWDKVQRVPAPTSEGG